MQSNVQDINNYKLNLEGYEIINEIGSGSYGIIFLVKKNNEIFVAKVLKKEQYSDQKKMLREIDILMKNQNPTIIKFYGYSLVDFDKAPNITIIMDYATNSSLYALFNSETIPTKYDDTAKQIILTGISRGMMLLHENNSIHRDLKPDNILLDQNLFPYISDFGLSKEFEFGKSFDQSISEGCIQYMAPEMLDSTKYNRKADVYAFAIIMFQVVTGSIPYKNVNDIQFCTNIKNGMRPKFEKPIKKSIQNLIEKCWDNDPNKRPSFSMIYKMLAFNFDEGEENRNDDDENKYYLENVNIDKFIEYLKIIDDDFKKYSDENDIKKYKTTMNSAKKCDEIDLLKEKLEQSENEKKEMQNKIDSLLQRISELNNENNVNTIYSHLKGVISVYEPKKI